MPWYVYIVSNGHHTLYIGMASDLARRIQQHRSGTFRNSYTSRYNFDRLVYFEVVSSQEAAVRRERQLKGWRRSRRIALIEQSNPEWRDLAAGDWGKLLCMD